MAGASSGREAKNQSQWYHHPRWAACIAVVALLAAYGIGSRSLDTGSWQQYFMTLGLLIIGGNRALHVLFWLVKRAKRSHA